MRWQAITERGIRLNHRTYDCKLLGPYRGQPSPVTTRGGKWEVHTNPHDARQIWLRLPDGQLAEIPWIHRAHGTGRSTNRPGSTSAPPSPATPTPTASRPTSPTPSTSSCAAPAPVMPPRLSTV
ncbi:Mu transposase C-terminal domain-containing protein [Streptomyces sp. NPDC000345]|uniref:Mu transposase C-terminal domain-containing protein n=1 Tax=Streptomyces sp. NPDC000345 TaxID=3364537 RepID=UPI0036B82E5B